jgi:hypothetical protein
MVPLVRRAKTDAAVFGGGWRCLPQPQFSALGGIFMAAEAYPVSLAILKAETEEMHAKVREFYSGKDPDLLGNLYLYDPIFGWCNLIVTLRIGIYHDQLHYEDAVKQARELN